MEKNIKKRSFWEILEKLFEPIFVEKRISFFALMPAVALSVLWIISVFLLKDITNSIENWLDFNLLFLFIGLIVLNYLILITTRNWQDWTLWPMFRKHLYNINITKFINLNNNESEKVWTWKMIAMIDKWNSSFVDILSKFFTHIVPAFIFIVLSFIFIWIINFYYWLVIFTVFIFVFIINVSLQKKAKFYRTKRRDFNIWITKKFIQILMSKFEILQNWKIQNELDFIWNSLEKNKNLNFKISKFNIAAQVLIMMIIDWSKVWIIIMFAIWLWWDVINFWEFVALMSIVHILDQIFRKTIQLYIDFTKTYVDIEKVWDFFDSSSEIKWYLEWKNFEYKKWEIELRNISYWYWEEWDENEELVFNNFDLKIAWWKVIAFVWNSWSWKSTLIKLISWYISTNSWEIFIDNQKISEISLKNYYKNIWYLTQYPSVFDWTILDNLTYAVERKLKKWELENILKQAKCEFIYDLKDWINTEIWERWVRLSWWQKQRLAIAKIFLKDPKIIFLDEPTSALDSFSEDQITKAMHNLFKNRTVVIVAHRLQTVKNADEIILFQDWKIKERW
jgi:ABC-type multidrug transport system fused ATPase/permease subunit